MKKVIAFTASAVLLAGCAGPGSESAQAAEKTPASISFDATIKNGESFLFELNPETAVSYQELRDNITEVFIAKDNWRSCFDERDVYREHYEYDEEGNQTDVYMVGHTESIILNDEYYYVDNWSRNGLEWQIFVDGTESMTYKTVDREDPPVTSVKQEELPFSGSDPMLILTDFTDSWGNGTMQKYEGTLNSYEMVSCSGDLKLLNSSVLQYQKLTGNIWYLAAYESEENYFVMFFQTDDAVIDREKEYRGAIYATNSYGELKPYTGYDVFTPWQAVILMMEKVNGE